MLYSIVDSSTTASSITLGYCCGGSPILDAIEIEASRLGANSLFHTIELADSVDVAASPSVLYDMVSDVTRMGEWSPECRRCRWESDVGEGVGSRFVGSNYESDAATGREWNWDMSCEVTAADRPHRFGWSVLTEAWDIETSVWTFLFEPHGDRTVMTETFVMKRPPTGLQVLLDRRTPDEQLAMIANRRERLDAGIGATLAALKASAERAEG